MRARARPYEEELLGSVMRFWERHCVDREHGGYLGCLDRDGTVYDTTKYLWMQWRIVYAFAALAETRLAGGSAPQRGSRRRPPRGSGRAATRWRAGGAPRGPAGSRPA